MTLQGRSPMDGWWFGWFGGYHQPKPLSNQCLGSSATPKPWYVYAFVASNSPRSISGHLFSEGSPVCFQHGKPNCPSVANLILPTIPNFTIHGFVAITWLRDTLGIFLSKLPPRLTIHFFIIPVIPVNWKFQLTSSPIVFCHIFLGGFNPSWKYESQWEWLFPIGFPICGKISPISRVYGGYIYS